MNRIDKIAKKYYARRAEQEAAARKEREARKRKGEKVNGSTGKNRQ